VLAGLGVPIVEVAAVRFVDPPLTPLMILRKMERRAAGEHSTERRYQWIALTAMPPDFLKLVLVAEDQRFLQHRGFDWKEIDAARRHASLTGRPARGASTITMQCARSLFLWQGRSWLRKGLEAYYTFWMETLLSKRRILELYANVIELGDGVYGIEAAARYHYGVSARELDREQSAMLAALLPNPRVWNPRAPTPALRARQAHLLKEELRLQPSLPR
jgi:monofunctional biosynthetic peptidoglycan transglycosylase